MSDAIFLRLQQLGLELPPPQTPIANFVSVNICGRIAYVSGQIGVLNGAIVNPGLLGSDVSLERGQTAARQAALQIVSQLQQALQGRLDRVEQCLRLGVFVAATPEFKDHPKVANGASDVIVDIFQERGRHARAAVGVAGLPFGASVEVDAVFQIKD